MNLLQKLNPKKAVSPDVVLTRILKDHAEAITPVLQVIYQQSLDTRVVPRDWKRANITAIFKKRSRQLVLNYRHLSLTSVSCKMLEHTILNIMDDVHAHKTVADYQHELRFRHRSDT